MKLRGGSFGLVILVIVMGVVLLLVAQAWQKMAPAAIDVTGTGAPVPVGDHGQTGASAEVRSGELPDLEATRNRTDAHAEDVQEAMKAIE